MGDLCREIIVTLDRRPDGMRAYEALRYGSHPLAVTYLDSLDDRLSSGEISSRFAQSLDYQFLRLVTAGDADDVAERIMVFFGPDEGWRSGISMSHGRVIMAEPNRSMQYGTSPAGGAVATAIGAPLTFGGQHSQYLGRLNVAAAHAAGVTGSGVRVAVVDSGIDAAAVRAAAFYDITTGSATAQAPQADSDGHGSAMAQIVKEVAPDCDIFGVRIVATGEPRLMDAMTGMAVAFFECAADIVNLSLSVYVGGTCVLCGGSRGTTLDYFTQSLSAAKRPQLRTRDGVVIVASTGNTWASRGFRHPAACAVVVAVGAVNQHSTRSSFSAHGTAKGRYLMAPGGDKSSPAVVTEYIGTGSTGPNAYLCGTSPACAYAAGMFALLWSEPANQSHNADRLIDTVLTNHCTVPAHVPPANQSEYGAGVVAY